MAHGAPDYSNVRKEDFVYRLDDMADLVARQSNLASLDRRGETIFIENFKYGISHWGQTTQGNGAEISLSATKFVSGGFSCKLVGGNNQAMQARIHKHLPYLRVNKMGVEARLLIGANNTYIELQQQFFDGSLAQYTGFRYNYVTRQLLIRKSLTSYETVATGVQRIEEGQYFSFMKMVYDFEAQEYVYVKFNDTEVDVSGESSYTFTTTADLIMSVMVDLQSQSGKNGSVYVDNIIVTRND